MFKTLMLDLIVPLLPAIWAGLGTVVVVLLGWVAQKLTAKFHAELSDIQQQLIQEAIGHGINWAETWANKETSKLGVKPTGSAKLDEAITLVQEELKANNIPAMATDSLVKLLEGKLHVDATWAANANPAAVVPPAVATATPAPKV